MPIGTVFDALWRGVGEALNDVRQRVVEEAWFGRPVTEDAPTAPPLEPPSNGWDMPREDFDTAWAAKAGQPEPGHGSELPGQDIER